MPALSPFRLARPSDPNAAIGLAARMMMNRPAFAQRPFGRWTSIIAGQARRGHQAFVVDAKDNAVGYYGYGRVAEAVAERWAAGGRPPTYEECLAGDCFIFNAWIADDRRVLRFMWESCRYLTRGSKTAYYKRFYPDGRMRVVRLPVNAAVASHIARAEAVPATSTQRLDDQKCFDGAELNETVA